MLVSVENIKAIKYECKKKISFDGGSVVGYIYYSLNEIYDSNMPTLRGAAESFVFAIGRNSGGVINEEVQKDLAIVGIF